MKANDCIELPRVMFCLSITTGELNPDNPSHRRLESKANKVEQQSPFSNVVKRPIKLIIIRNKSIWFRRPKLLGLMGVQILIFAVNYLICKLRSTTSIKRFFIVSLNCRMHDWIFITGRRFQKDPKAVVNARKTFLFLRRVKLLFMKIKTINFHSLIYDFSWTRSNKAQCA